MKTKHLIEILRCPGDHRVNCAKCEVLESCKELAGQDLYGVCAERLEQLLDNLRRTEAELKETKAWRRFVKSVTIVFYIICKKWFMSKKLLVAMGDK